jgi:tetratricopeptide (TPR) repeat protein/class 3 adenylate cyclase
VVQRALAKRRVDRYATALEMAAAIDALRIPSRVPRPPQSADIVVIAAIDRASMPVDTPPTGALAASERRHVTILACTLAGYDALIEQLMPEELARVLVAVRADAAAVAAHYGGVLNEFTGDQLVLLFGVPVTREDDALRAARAALDLHARVAAIAPAAELPEATPALHSGIDTGIVVTQPAEDGVHVFRVSGPTSHVAARLAEHAGLGEVWLSSETRKRIAPFFETEERNALTLGDKRPPLVPYRLVRETGVRARIESTDRAELTAFTGRELELAQLRRSREELEAEGGQLVLVTGEAGLGKSRLLHEFRHALCDAEVSVLIGRCQSYGGGVAYLPFIDLLRNGLGIGPAGFEHAVVQIRAISPALEEFIPLFLNLLSIPSAAYPIPRHLQGDAFRLAMQDALAAILTLNAQRRPCVTVFEDWHWADEASQAVLRQISDVLPGYPLLLVVTSRPGYGAESALPERVVQIALKPLEQGSTGVMLRAMLGADALPDELVPLIQQRTGGNPFFIEEICRALLEDGSLRMKGGAALLASPLLLPEIPDSIQAVIRSRFDRLELDARDLLRLAAVTGVEFGGNVIKAAFPDRSDLAHTLDALKAAGLIQQTRLAPLSEYRFKHVLTQEVAYASLLEHQRRELHGRVGAILERLHGDGADDQLDRLAHHFSRANAWAKAVQYGLLSAQRANRLAQYPEALLILERTQRWILQLPPGSARDSAVIDILLQQERLCETLGQRARQQQLIDQVIALLGGSADRARLAEAWLRQGDLLTLLRRFAEAEEPLQRALGLRRELADRVGERNALRSLGLLRWYEGRNLEALDLAEQTLRIARERGDVGAVASDLTNCGAILRALGEHEQAQQVLEEALDTGKPATGEYGAASDELAIKHVYALQNLSHCYRERGDRKRALECLQRAGAIAAQKRLPIALSYHYTSMAHLHLQEGRIPESLASYREAIELTRRARYAPGLAQSLRIYGDVLVGLGRPEEALPCLQEAATTFAQLRDAEGEGSVWSAVATIEEQLQHSAAALVAWGKACALRQQLADRAGELIAVEGLARTTRVQLPESPLALAYYQRGVQLAEGLADHAAEGRMRNVMGILEWQQGEYAAALGHYERAFELFSSLDDVTHAGLMLNSMGATLKLLDRSTEAEQRLREGLRLHERSGQKQLEAHALALIGDLLVARDDIDHAFEQYSRSLEIRRSIGDRRGEGWMLHSVARCELARGEPYRVREHLIAATRLADQCGDAELAAVCTQLRRIADH